MTDMAEKLTKVSDARKGWEKLITTPEWATLMGVLQEQVDGYQRVVLFRPLGKLEDALAQEYMKGQIEGRLSLANTVETIMEGLDSELMSLRRQDESGK
jgi:hypothetical protein